MQHTVRFRPSIGPITLIVDFQRASAMTSIDAGKWAECEAIIKRFEQAWLDGPRPSIAAFLSTDQPWTPALLVELVHIDLEFRFKAGESPRLEPYLRDFPELSSDRAAALGLMAAE